MASQGLFDPDTIIILAAIAALVLVALARIFHRLRLGVKKGDLDVSIAGDKAHGTGAASGPPTAPPSSFDQRGQTVQNQTNIAGHQYNVGRDIVINAALAEEHDNSESEYRAYLLGLTLARIAWQYANPIELAGLKMQYGILVQKLELDVLLAAKFLDTFKTTSILPEVLENAKLGIESRDVLHAAILSHAGKTASEAFRLGFNIVYLMPQLELLQTAQETKTPCPDLLVPMASEFQNLLKAGHILKLSERIIEGIRDAHRCATTGEADRARTALGNMGEGIGQELKCRISEVI